MAETLHTAAQAFIEHLREQGKSERTLYTYSKDIEQIEAFFGADRKLSTIRSQQVGKFLRSDELLKLANGKDRAEPTVQKTVRVLRMFLLWAQETTRIKTAPLPKAVPLGRTGEQGDKVTSAAARRTATATAASA